jgi:hypothetical protein
VCCYGDEFRYWSTLTKAVMAMVMAMVTAMVMVTVMGREKEKQMRGRMTSRMMTKNWTRRPNLTVASAKEVQQELLTKPLLIIGVL